MAAILLTGLSGTGKSSALSALADRGSPSSTPTTAGFSEERTRVPGELPERRPLEYVVGELMELADGLIA